MDNSSPTLVHLAKAKFADLSPNEELFFRLTEAGNVVSFKPQNETTGDVGLLRAACIAWVCTDSRALACLTHHGVQLVGADIDGVLDLSQSTIAHPLRMLRCIFRHEVRLYDAQLRVL